MRRGVEDNGLKAGAGRGNRVLLRNQAIGGDYLRWPDIKTMT